ncbi:hypothetical protein G6L94_11855 [Agrobacterium rhizogenes]|nr:hypothetical protein [Rhizobium rhizogenes]NTI94383.1 hypothetical protein [Rhizobium rhizogenes]NTJ56850.1 hypothetical protein [Rhizobium rhizogenes]OCJ14922.1 hypothetical protein A6U89_22745 [Agrobacterium sp. B133/95]
MVSLVIYAILIILVAPLVLWAAYRKYKSFLYRILWGDWRIRSVFISFVIASAVTLGFYHFVSDATNASTFIGAAFASWVSGLLLFIFVGLMVTIVSLSRPEHELFEARARNLLRRQTGNHIDYMVGRLHEVLEAYTASSLKKITILDYDEQEQKFHTSHLTENVLKGYLDDKAVDHPTKIKYTAYCTAPAGKQRPSLSFLEVNGDKVGDAVEFDEQIERPFRIQIPLDGAYKGKCVARHRYTYWMQAQAERNVGSSIRYTRELVVEVENQLPTTEIAVLIMTNEVEAQRIVVQPGATQRIISLSEITPKDELYDFRIVLA